MTDQSIRFQEIPGEKNQWVAVATLNAEKSLNAISLEMIQALQDQLTLWEKDERIACVFLQGSGEKAFCAGGDIRRLYESMLACDGNENPYAVEFFAKEYRLDYHIHTYTKPIIVWATGAIMGGGMGLCNGASHRVVTETTRMAMPETAIGLYPDVGSTVFLNQMPEGVGLFLGLTGVSINAADALVLGLADHMIDSQQRQRVLDALAHIPWDNDASLHAEQISALLREFKATPPASHIDQHQKIIAALTSENSLPAIYDNIANYKGDDKWLQSAAKAIGYACPTSLYLVYEQLQRGKTATLLQAFQQELILSINAVGLGNFQEGIRALLIDKDRSPNFKPATVAEVSQDFVDQHFIDPWDKGTHPLADL